MSDNSTSLAKNHLEALDLRLLSFGSPSRNQVFRRSFRWMELGTEHSRVSPTEMNPQALIYHGRDHQVHEHSNSTFCRSADVPCEGSNHVLDTSQASHINLLPPEILSEIFIQYHQDSNLPCGPHCPKGWTPVLLTHICRHWRDLAYSLSTLWSSFSVAVFHYDVASVTKGLLAWLHRSQTRPLALRLVSMELCPVLLPYIHRWEHIELLVTSETAEQILALPLASAPALKSIRVEVGKCNPHVVDKVISLVHSIPTLRRLSWFCRETPSIFLDVSFPHLTHVTLPPSICVDQFISFLSGCEQLVAVVAKDLQPPSMPMTDAVVVLPHLVSLEARSAMNTRDLLDRLTLPSLLRLRLDEATKAGVTYGKHQVLANLIARSSCKLTTLELHDIQITEEDLIGYLTLPCLEFVEEAHFMMCNFSERAVRLLIYRKPSLGGRNIFTRLTRLHVRLCTALDGLFSEMVESRWIPTRRACEGDEPASLRFVKVEFSCAAWTIGPVPPHDVDIARFKEFMDCGLDIRYRDP